MQVIHFEKEKETQNTIRFKEIPEDGKPPILGTLYVQKWAFKDKSKLKVTIEAE